MNTNSFFLFLSRSERDGGLLVGIFMYTHMYKVNPSSRWAQTHHLPCSCLWMLTPGNMGHQVFSPTPLAGTDPLTHVRAHTYRVPQQMTGTPVIPSTAPPVVSPERQTRTWLSDHTIRSLDSLA